MEQIKIESRKELHSVINEVIELREQLAVIADKITSRESAAEKYSKAYPADAFQLTKNSDETEFAKYSLQSAAPSLRRQPDVSEADVVELLGAAPATEKFVKKTYDSDTIKAEFGGTKKRRIQVKAYGLMFTNPKPHLKIEKR